MRVFLSLCHVAGYAFETYSAGHTRTFSYACTSQAMHVMNASAQVWGVLGFRRSEFWVLGYQRSGVSAFLLPPPGHGVGHLDDSDGSHRCRPLRGYTRRCPQRRCALHRELRTIRLSLAPQLSAAVASLESEAQTIHPPATRHSTPT